MLKATPRNTGGGNGGNQYATGTKTEPVANDIPTYAELTQNKVLCVFYLIIKCARYILIKGLDKHMISVI